MYEICFNCFYVIVAQKRRKCSIYAPCCDCSKNTTELARKTVAGVVENLHFLLKTQYT